MRKFNLLQRAYMDIQAAEAIRDYNFTDELQYDVLSYHVQQAIEKIMKFELESVGVEFPFDHRMNIIYELMKDSGLSPPEWIWENRFILNSYATETRYSEDLVATKRESLEILDSAKDYYNDIVRQQEAQQYKNG